jgi:hypothetical protein
MLVLATDANIRSTSSPTAWPNRSLIDLKWSRSKASTVIGRARRAFVCVSSRVTSISPRRLNRPVSGSVSAAVLWVSRIHREYCRKVRRKPRQLADKTHAKSRHPPRRR